MKKHLINVLKWLWLVGILAFIVLFLYKRYPLVQEQYALVPGRNFFISFLVLTVAKLVLTLFMYYSVIFVGKYLPLGECYRVYHTSQLAKYLPGNIWHFVTKASAYKTYGFTLNEIKNAMLVENILLVLSAFLFGIGILFSVNYDFLIQLFLKYRSIFYAFCALLLLCLVLFFKFFDVRSYLSFKTFNGKMLINICVLLIFVWLTLGLNFYIILRPFLPESHCVLEIFGLFAIAFSLGYITPFAPAGIGIRESVLVLGLTAYHLSYETVIIVSALTRIIYVILELILAALSIFLPKSPGRNLLSSKP